MLPLLTLTLIQVAGFSRYMRSAVIDTLGLGLPPPHADWGTMLSNGPDDLFNGYWWLVYPPAIVLIITIVAFSLIGDAVRDSLDTRLRRR